MIPRLKRQVNQLCSKLQLKNKKIELLMRKCDQESAEKQKLQAEADRLSGQSGEWQISELKAKVDELTQDLAESRATVAKLRA